MAFIRTKGNSNQLTLEEITALTGGKVIKRYKDKIVFAKPPAKPKKKRKPTPAQKINRKFMLHAVYFAKDINADPVKKAQWKKRAKGYSNVYQAALSWYMINEPKRIAKQEEKKKIKSRSKS